MDAYQIDSQGLDDLAWDNMGFENNLYEVVILYGKSGVGKTEIIKQFLSRTKGNKLYINKMLDCNLTKLNDFSDHIVVLDEILPFDAQKICNFIKMNKKFSKNGKVIIITQFAQNLKDIKQLLNDYFVEGIDDFNVVELSVSSSFTSEYMYASTIYGGRRGIEKVGPKGPYWGDEEISTIEC